MKIAYTGWTWLSEGERETLLVQLENSFGELKKLGYDYMENFAYIADFFPDPAELTALLRKYDVRLVNLYGFFDFDVEASLERSKKQIDFLAAVGGSCFNCQNTGFGDNGPPERPTDGKMVAVTAHIANELGKYARGKGIQICLHPHYGTCVFTQSDIDAFLTLTDPENVRLCPDTAHLLLAGMDPAGAIRRYGDRISYVHLKDVDTNALSRAQGSAKMSSFRALGEGDIDFPAVMNALRGIGYDGYLCVELDNPRISNEQSAETSRNYIRRALGM